MVRHSSQVDGYPSARQGDLLLALMRLKATHARAQPLRRNFDLIADVQWPIEQRAGYHRAKAADREGAIDRQTRLALRLRARGRAVKLGV